jgi:hypothetical protein
MFLFNNYQLGNQNILHTSSNSSKMFKYPWQAARIMRKILEVEDMGGFRVAKADCTGGVSTRVCQRAGMVAVHKLLYDEYKVDNKVVFQNTTTRVPALAVMSDRLQQTACSIHEKFSKLYFW